MESVSPPDASAPSPARTAASARWRLLRRALLSVSSRSPLPADTPSVTGIESISRKAGRGFGMIPCHILKGSSPSRDATGFPKDKNGGSRRDACFRYILPTAEPHELLLYQRMDNCITFNDFKISTRHNVDNTGIVCCWPAEDVLAHYCLKNAEMFRSKRVLELGAGYGLAGLAVAAGTDAHEVIISDGNPQVVDYIQRSIVANDGNFDETKVEAMTLHWDNELDSSVLNSFDVILASDCTFFKEFHESLAQLVKALLRSPSSSGTPKAIFLNPKRGNSLEQFLGKAIDTGLRYEMVKNYDDQVWARHLTFLAGDDPSWPGYEEDHCYPLMVSLTLENT